MALSVICLVILVFSVLFDCLNITIIEFLIIRIDDVDAMYMNLFTIQATISVTGAAIISLLTGVTSKEYYGISVSKFITRINPFIFKHNIVILFTFVITVLDYFFVALKFFNISIAIFICSVVALIYLVRDTFVIFLGDDEIKKEFPILLLRID